MKEQWIKQMQQKMAGYQEPASEVSWDEVENAVAGHRQQAKTVPLWPRRIAAAVLLLVVAMVGYKALEKDATISEKQTELSQQISTTRQGEASQQENPLLAEDKQTGRETIHTETILKAEAVLAVVAEDSVVEEAVSSPSEPEQVQDTRTEQQLTYILRQEPSVYLSDFQKPLAKKNRLMAKLFLSNAFGKSSHLMTSRRIVENSKFSWVDDEDDQEEHVSLGENINPSGGHSNNDNQGEDNSNEENNQENPSEARVITTTTETITTTQQTHHHQPIHYGLSLRYRLNERWGMETGLTYSLLTSDITTTAVEQKTDSKQSLNYIGIPLKAEYLLWGSRHFDVYVSAGTMVEKMVKGKIENVGKTTNVSIHPLQLSVSSGIGAECKYNSLFSIYVEPGVSYYFDNGSNVSTFYQDKPLNFNLNVGLRFQIDGRGEK